MIHGMYVRMYVYVYVYVYVYIYIYIDGDRQTERERESEWPVTGPHFAVVLQSLRMFWSQGSCLSFSGSLIFWVKTVSRGLIARMS